MELGTGEALVSFLDQKGAPSIVERVKMMFPLSSIGAILPAQREMIIKQSRLYGMYERNFDRESAYEMITQEDLQRAKREEQLRAENEREKEEIARQKAMEKERRELEKAMGRRPAKTKSAFDKAFGSAATSIGRSIGTQIARGILGAIFKR